MLGVDAVVVGLQHADLSAPVHAALPGKWHEAKMTMTFKPVFRAKAPRTGFFGMLDSNRFL